MKRALAFSFATAIGLVAAANQAHAQERLAFDLPVPRHAVGSRTTSQNAQGLSVEVSILQLNVTEGKSRVCVRFQNDGTSEWRGGYRLTDRNDGTTFATINIVPRDYRTRCESLPVVPTYFVVLRRDG